MMTPVDRFIELLFREQEERSGWLLEVGERLRQEGVSADADRAGRASSEPCGLGHSATITDAGEAA